MTPLQRAAMRALLCAGLACAGMALAQQAAQTPSVNQQARELAKRLGREQSAEGLEAILQAGNADLLQSYEWGFRETTMRLYTEKKYADSPLPADIEALLVKYYRDARIGGALRVLTAANGTRYRTRQLFDLMLQEWRSGRVRPSTYEMRTSALSTQAPEAEQALLEWMQASDRPTGEDAKAIVSFLGQRQYRPAIPFLAAMAKEGRGELASLAAQSLLKLGGPQATAAAIDRIAALSSGAPDDVRMAEYFAAWIAERPRDEPLDYAAFRKALGASPSDSLKRSLIAVARRRGEARAVPELLALLAEERHFQPALEALADFDDPEAWKQARAQVDKLRHDARLDAGRYRYASSLLDAAIASPAGRLAEKRQRLRGQELSERSNAFTQAYAAARKARDGDPERYVAVGVAHLDALEKLAAEYADLPAVAGMRQALGEAALNLGHFVRFRMRRGAAALDFYARAARHGSPLGAYAVADTYQFDLRDRVRARAEYQRILEGLAQAPPARNGMEAASALWARRWLEHQIRFLDTGGKFGGRIGDDDVAAATLIVFLGAASAMQDDVFDLAPLYERVQQTLTLPGAPRLAPLAQRGEVARKLESLPPSGFVLARTVSLASLLPDAASIIAYLARHDPAGYASACLFGMVELAERQGPGGEAAMMLPGLAQPAGAANPMREARARFVRAHGVVLAP